MLLAGARFHSVVSPVAPHMSVLGLFSRGAKLRNLLRDRIRINSVTHIEMLPLNCASMLIRDATDRPTVSMEATHCVPFGNRQAAG